jgi:hypothetical protein
MTGEFFYAALLSLYPKPFRLRFGAEMLQLYRDCYPGAPPVQFWMATLKDFVVSVPREWQREVRREDSAIDYTAIGEGIMVVGVVAPILLWWGWIGTVFVLNLDVAAQNLWLLPGSGFLILALATLTIGFLVGVVSTIAAARTGRIETTLWSKLDDSGKATAPLSR